MVFNNKYINLSKLNYLKTYSKLQIIQKPNGDYLCSYKKGVVGNQDEIKVMSFRTVDTNNNVKDIEILQESILLHNTNSLHILNRFIFMVHFFIDIISYMFLFDKYFPRVELLL